MAVAQMEKVLLEVPIMPAVQIFAIVIVLEASRTAVILKVDNANVDLGLVGSSVIDACLVIGVCRERVQKRAIKDAHVRLNDIKKTLNYINEKYLPDFLCF